MKQRQALVYMPIARREWTDRSDAAGRIHLKLSKQCSHSKGTDMGRAGSQAFPGRANGRYHVFHELCIGLRRTFAQRCAANDLARRRLEKKHHRQPPDPVNLEASSSCLQQFPVALPSTRWAPLRGRIITAMN